MSLRNDAWLEDELERALPVPYFRGVLTAPPVLRALALRGERQAARVYGVLFRAARRALRETAAGELGEQGLLGLTLILHTWNAEFDYHPHLHAIVTAGALSRCGTRWLQPAPGRSLFPLDALQERYREALLAEFTKELERGRKLAELAAAHGEHAPAWLVSAEEGQQVLRRLRRIGYLHVFAKATLNQEQAFRYVARYTSRGGFSNARLESYDREADCVVYRSKHGKQIECTSQALLERFVLHLLPRGMHRIRRSELIAPRSRKLRLAQARAALNAPPLPAEAEDEDEGLGPTARFYLRQGVDLRRCPHPGCKGEVWSRKLARRSVPLGQLHARLRSPRVPP